MASLRITEFSSLHVGMEGATPTPSWPAVAHQAVTITTETKSSAFNAATRIIRVQAEAICCIDIAAPGVVPEATTGMVRLTAGMTEYFGVSPGGKLSVITST